MKEPLPPMATAFKRIDHIAIAVNDLQQAVDYYQNVLGMACVEQREVVGQKTSMLSAVMDAGSFAIVLVQGGQPESQVSRYIQHYGQGVQHIAFEVDNLDESVDNMTRAGVEFSTDILTSNDLKQIFTKREPASGMMYELIQRTGQQGFQEQNVKNLFSQLEDSESY